MDNGKAALVCIAIIGGFGLLLWLLALTFLQDHRTRCTFDHNELGPMGTDGQWWWDIYKCTDGTERRVLVAGPRG